jgi:hypothetical protein
MDAFDQLNKAYNDAFNKAVKEGRKNTARREGMKAYNTLKRKQKPKKK